MIGLAVLQLLSWYWLRFGAGGLDGLLPILGAIAAVALVVIARQKRETFHAPTPARSASTVGLIVAVAAAFVAEFRVPLRIGHLTSASIYNADVGYYVTIAGNLVSHGYAGSGNIANVNLGAIATNGHGIGPGVYATLAAAAAGTRLGTWQASLPLLLVAVGLGALAVRDAARLVLPGSLVAAPVIALLATTASLFGYVTVNYFLAQVLVMPLVLGELIVLHAIARPAGRRERVAALVLLGATVVIAILSYSPMAFAMQPIIVGIVCVAECGPGWLRRSARVVASTVGTFIVAFALAPAPFVRSASFVQQSLRRGPGWPLALMTPLNVLGIRAAIHSPRPMAAAFVVEAAIVGVVVLTAVWLLWNVRRSAAILCAAAALVVLGSYAAVYADRGYSYAQWKWISFFQPVFIVAVYALVVAGAGAVVTRWPPARRSAGRAAGAVLAVALIASSARTLTAETQDTRAVWAAGEPTLDWSIVRSPLSQLAARPALDRLPAVNLDLSPWDTVWAAYFLAPTTRVYLGGFPGFFYVAGRIGYVPLSISARSWTLEPVAAPNAPANDGGVGYVVVHHVPPVGGEAK